MTADDEARVRRFLTETKEAVDSIQPGEPLARLTCTDCPYEATLPLHLAYAFGKFHTRANGHCAEARALSHVDAARYLS